MQYYDGTKLLSMSDINGDKPELYICTSNRSAGKTTYFGRYLVNRFLKCGEKFCLIYRFAYELDGVSEKFFKELRNLFFFPREMTAEKRAKGVYVELFIDKKPCGYAIALNNADQIKKLSHLFADTSRMLMDEFQSETNHYASNEVEKFISIHTSIARGGGKQVRYLPVYMLSNGVSILNPYYTALGISERLNNNTKFLKGDGFILEQGHNESASESQKASAFNRAFKSSRYVSYSAENVYLNDNVAFIQKMHGKSRYVCTLRCDGKDYAVREYAAQGIIYCDKNVDGTFPTRISVTTDDHMINYVMLKQYTVIISVLKQLFERGCFRFKDLESKACIMKALSY